jgi:hypothetical protein
VSGLASTLGNVIAAVACCPHPPLLVPEIGAGAAAELDSLRSSCDEAVRRLIASGPQSIVVVGADGPPGGLRRFGFDKPIAGADGDGLPLSLTIGRWLLHRAGWVGPVRMHAVPGDPVVDPTERVGLLVLGDGSARRTLKAPGYFDARAELFDAAVAAALRAGESKALRDLDETAARELLVGGYDAWQALAGLTDGLIWRADLLYDDAPYGVGYFVASWLPA